MHLKVGKVRFIMLPPKVEDVCLPCALLELSRSYSVFLLGKGTLCTTEETPRNG